MADVLTPAQVDTAFAEAFAAEEQAPPAPPPPPVPTAAPAFEDHYRSRQRNRDAQYWDQEIAALQRPQARDAMSTLALVRHLAPEYGVDADLAYAVARVESAGQANVVSRAGAQGVMQLMPETQQRYHVGNAFDAEANIRGGLAYLRDLQALFPGRRDLQLAAYNAGEGAVLKYNKAVPPYPETQEYLQRVQAILGLGSGAAYTSKRPGGEPLSPADVSAGLGLPGQPFEPPTRPPPIDREPAQPVATPTLTNTGLGGPEARWEAVPPGTPEPAWTPVRKPIEPTPLGLLQAGVGLAGSVAQQAARVPAHLASGFMSGLEGVIGGVKPLEATLGLDTGLGNLAVATAQDIHTYLTEALTPSATPTLLDKIAQGVGQGISSIGPGLLLTAATGGLAAPALAPVVGAAASGLLGGMQEAYDSYQQLAPILGEQEALKRARTTLLITGAIETIGNAAGIFNDLLKPGLRHMLISAIMNGAEEGIEYSTSGEEFWVPADHPSAQPLLQAGWQRQGDRVVQPYVLKDQLEATLIGAVVGGVFSGLRDIQGLPLPDALKPLAQDEGFSVQRAVQAAQQPTQPPGDVPLATWQRWGKAVLDLLPEPGYGGNLVQRILSSDQGSLRLFQESGMAVRALPQSQVRDAEGNLQRMYHGTSQAFGQFAPERADPHALYGPGFYFTDSPVVAGGTVEEVGRGFMGYAGSETRQHEAARASQAALEGEQDRVTYYRRELQLAEERFAAEQEMMTPQARQNRERRVEQYRRQLAEAQQAFSAAQATQRQEEAQGPNVHPVYLNIQHPFDMQAPVTPAMLVELSDAAFMVGNGDTATYLRYLSEQHEAEPLTGEKLYDLLQDPDWYTDADGHRMQARGRTKERINTILHQAGYDGITHIGGAITGGEPHRVYIAFTPEQVIPALQLEAQAVEPPSRAPGGILTSERGAVGGEPPPIRRGEPPITPTPTPPTQTPGVVAGPPPVPPPGPTPPGATPGVEPLQTPVPGMPTPPEHAISEERAVADQAQMTIAAARDRIAFYTQEIARDTQQLTAEGATMDPDARAALETRLSHDHKQLTESQDALQAATAWQQTHQAFVQPPPPTQAPGVVAGPPPVPPVGPQPPGGTPGVQPLAPPVPALPSIRTEAMQWRVRIDEMPSQELELQDFLRQQGGISLTKEPRPPDAISALLSSPEAAATGLRHNRVGHPYQEIMQKAYEQGFLAHPDAESFLHVLERSIGQGQNVYSAHSTGHVPVVDTPVVAQAYEATKAAIATLEQRTETQARGVRPHAEVMAEAQQLIANGQMNLEDIRTLLPGTTLDDAHLGALTLRMAELGEHLQQTAQRVVETGGRPGSQEVQDYLTTKAMFAETIPTQRGAVAETGRTLSFLNEPMAAYTRYLEDLQQVLAQQGPDSVLQMARGDLAIQTPAERLQAEAAAQPGSPEQRAREQSEAQRLQQWLDQNFLTPWQGPLTDQRLLLSPEEQAQQAEMARLAQSLRDYLDRNALTPDQGELIQQRLLYSPEELVAQAQREQGRIDWDAWLQAHGREPAPRFPPPPGVEQLELLATSPSLATNLVQARPGFAQMFTELQSASLLGPTSWQRNGIGNSLMGIYHLGPMKLGEMVGALHEGGMQWGETDAFLWGLTHGMREHLQAAMRMWTTGQTAFGEPGKTDTGREPAVTAANLQALGFPINPDSPMGKAFNVWAEYLGWANGGRTGLRIMNTTDELYKSFWFHAARNEFAFRRARELGLEGSPFQDWVAQLASDPTTMKDIDSRAMARAAELTLTNTPEKSMTSWAVQKMAGWRLPIPFTEQQFPIGRLLWPFVKMPLASARFAAQNTPIGLFMLNTWRTIARGGPEADLMWGRLIMGSLLTAAVAGLAGTGNIVGRAPDDPVLRAIWLKQHPEYSFRVPGTDTWLSYRIDPFGNMLGMIMDAAQLMGELHDEPAARLTTAVWVAAQRNLWSQTAAKNLSDLFAALTPGRGVEGNDLVQNLLRYGRQQGIPTLARTVTMGATASWMGRAFSRMDDPEVKEAKGLLDGLYAQMFGWSWRVARRRAITGEPELYGYGIGPGALRTFLRGFSALQIQQEVPMTPGNKMIMDNDMQLQKAGDFLLPLPRETGESATDVLSAKDLSPTHLTPGQAERWQVLAALNEAEARTLYPDIVAERGRVIPEQLLRQVTSAVARGVAGQAPPKAAMDLGEMLDWLATTRRLADDRLTSPGRDGGKHELFKLVVKAYKDAAQPLFLALEPDVQERYDAGLVQRQLQRIPEPQRPRVQLQMQGAYRQRRAQEQRQLGLTQRPTVGAAP